MILFYSRTALLMAAVSIMLPACGGGGGGDGTVASAAAATDTSTSSSTSSGSTSSSGTSSSSTSSSSTSSSSGSTSSSTSSSSGGGTSLGTDAKIIFLHHSTGGVIWNAGVANRIASYNAAHSTSYQISDRAFPASSPYGWNNYPYDYWNIWIKHAGSQAYLNEPTLEILAPQYDVIIWKHCFPVSSVSPDTGTANADTALQTLQNFKLQYAALKTKMLAFPNTRFIVWTAPALIDTRTDAASGDRAQAFATWVKDVWDVDGDNIFVWDFRQLETNGLNGGRYLLNEYSYSVADKDSHPNSVLANKAAPLFVQRIIDVVQGRGDTGSVTGE